MNLSAEQTEAMLELDSQLIEKNQEVKEAHAKWVSAKERLSEEKKILDRKQTELSELVDELEEIKRGNWQRRLNFQDQEEEAGATIPIDARWFNPENGEERAIDDPPPEKEQGDWLMVGYHGHPFCQEDGTIVGGFDKKANIPLEKTEELGCVIEVWPTKGPTGKWTSLIVAKVPEKFDETSYPHINQDSYETKKESTLASVVYVHSCITGRTNLEKFYREDLEAFISKQTDESIEELRKKYIEVPE